MRFTIVDGAGAVTFTAPPHVRKMLAAAASRDPEDADALLRLAEEYDPQFFGQLLADAATPDRAETTGPHLLRVDGDESRRLSMEPAPLGLLVYNLLARRIVQVQNSYADLQRRDRGRLRRDGRPVRAYYRYTLPDDWSIVP